MQGFSRAVQTLCSMSSVQNSRAYYFFLFLSLYFSLEVSCQPLRNICCVVEYKHALFGVFTSPGPCKDGYYSYFSSCDLFTNMICNERGQIRERAHWWCRRSVRQSPRSRVEHQRTRHVLHRAHAQGRSYHQRDCSSDFFSCRRRDEFVGT